MKIIRILPALIFLVDGCIDPLNLPSIRSKPALVVDGMISDQPGPYEIKLYRSSSLNQNLDEPKRVSGAAVKISDDIGNVENLTETSPGIYKTSVNGIQGESGRTYQLHITTEDGNEYESTPATLTPAGEIDSLYFEFKENILNPNEAGKPHDAVIVYVDAKGSPGNPNLFRWRWTGTYQVHTYPERHVRFFELVAIPDPLPCSGMIFEDGELKQIAECECCDCWLTQCNTKAIVSPNEYAHDARFNRVQLTQIPVDKYRFYAKYHIAVEQLSVQEDVYDFWRLVRVQQEGTENIFQPNIVKIKGNIHSVTDSDEEVFGVFSVSAVVKKSIFVHRSAIPKNVPEIEISTSDCRITFPGSTNQMPAFW